MSGAGDNVMVNIKCFVRTVQQKKENRRQNRFGRGDLSCHISITCTMKSIHHLPLPALSCLYAVLLVTAFSYSCSGYSMHVSSTKQFHVFQHKVKTVGAIGLSPKGRQNTGREALSSNVQHPKTTRAFDDLVWGHQNDLVCKICLFLLTDMNSILKLICYCVAPPGGG